MHVTALYATVRLMCVVSISILVALFVKNIMISYHDVNSLLVLINLFVLFYLLVNKYIILNSTY